MGEKLSDLIKWDADALNLLDSILSRVRAKVAEDCKTQCFKNNRPRIEKAVLLHVMHGLKPLAWFIDPDDADDVSDAEV